MLTVEVTLPGRLHADLAVAREVVALVGTNGSGKTTLLHAVAGLVAGRVGYDGEDWSARPPQQRRVGLVHQDHQLFPHLTALDNVAFGPRARGTSRRTAREEAAGLLERFGLGALAGRRPHELSGGQAQRVALARALATGPDVLLLDEPFAALDVAVAQELRELLAEHLAGFPGPVLLATHDVLDVAALAGRVVVLDGQRVVQDGSPAAVAEVPGTSHAAQLLGINVVRGTAATGVVTTAADTLVAASHLDGPVVATFPPSAVTITRERPTGSARNAWLTRVVGLADLGDLVRLHLRSGTGLDLRADVTPGAVRSLRLAPGEEVWASVKATEVTVFSTARPGGVSPRSR